MRCHIVRRIQTERGEIHLQMFPELPMVPSPGWTLRDANGRMIVVEATTLVLGKDSPPEVLCRLEGREGVDLGTEEQAGWLSFP